MTTFDKKEFDSVEIFRFCKSNFNHDYNNRTIILQEICDKEKLKLTYENNDFDEEVNNITEKFYDGLDSKGRKIVKYKQNNSKNRYYGDNLCLTMLKREIRNFILPKNIKDIDMSNCHLRILSYLCEKYKLNRKILKNYVLNREEILSKFGDRKKIKELFLSIINGLIKDTYSDNKS